MLSLLALLHFLSGAAIDTGPLAEAAPGFSHASAFCTHMACGSYTDRTTGLVVSYFSSPPESGPESCEVPPGTTPESGVIHGIPYCSILQPNARQQQLAQLYQEHPAFRAHPEWLQDVSMSPEGATFFHIALITPHVVWHFHADICTEAEAAAVHRLLFEHLVLSEPEQ